MADKKEEMETRAYKVQRRKQYYETRYAKSLENADKEHRYYRGEQWDQKNA